MSILSGYVYMLSVYWYICGGYWYVPELSLTYPFILILRYCLCAISHCQAFVCIWLGKVTCYSGRATLWNQVTGFLSLWEKSMSKGLVCVVLAAYVLIWDPGFRFLKWVCEHLIWPHLPLSLYFSLFVFLAFRLLFVLFCFVNVCFRSYSISHIWESF